MIVEIYNVNAEYQMLFCLFSLLFFDVIKSPMIKAFSAFVE